MSAIGWTRVLATAATVATAAAVAATGGCAVTNAGATAKLAHPDVVVAAVPATGASGLYIAEQRGFFAQAGLDVTIKSSVSAATTVEELLHGAVDITLGQWTSAIVLEAGGARLRALASGNNGGPGLEVLTTLAGSPVKRVGDLAGKRVAVNVRGGLSEMLVDSVLKSAGINPQQVQFVVTPFPLMALTLVQHKADVAFMVEPYLSQAEQRQGVAALRDVDQGATEDFPITGYFATAAWARKYPATAAAFQSALERGQAVAAADRLAVQQALIRFTGVAPDTAAVMSLGTFPQGVDPVQLERVADLMQTSSLLSPHADPAALVAELTN